MQITKDYQGKGREGLTSLSACVIMNYKKGKEEPNMFFLKKKRENENIETTLKEYLSQTSDMYRQENSATGEILDRIQNEQVEMQNFLRKKMETLDDFLDQLQEDKEADDELKELQEKSSEREKKLCQLISIYSEQLHTIEEFLSDKEGWHEQFRMMSQKRKQVGSLAQIQEIGTVGEPFNYRLHDIIKTEETDQETVDGIISRVYAPGLLYQGQVIKKAQVCVYKK